MNLVFRLLYVIFGAWRWPALKASDSSVLKFRVWPLDMDLNLHLTNSRYLALMDLGRTDLILRSGMWKLMKRDRLAVVLGGVAMRFRRSLPPFARFTLTTRLLGWDERWVYVEQIFTGPQGLACSAVLRSTFLKNGKIVEPAQLFTELLPKDAIPRLPDWVADWMAVESEFAG